LRELARNFSEVDIAEEILPWVFRPAKMNEHLPIEFGSPHPGRLR